MSYHCISLQIHRISRYEHVLPHCAVGVGLLGFRTTEWKKRKQVTDRRTMGQDVFVAAYSMYLQANTMTTHPLVPHGT